MALVSPTQSYALSAGQGLADIWWKTGRIVVKAIEDNQPYIFPHGEFRDEVAAYFDDMLAAFPTEYEIDAVRKAGEERRAKMTAEAKAIADAL